MSSQDTCESASAIADSCESAFFLFLEVPNARSCRQYKMATASTPARSRRPSHEEDATASHQPNCSASPPLDQTVRFPLLDHLHLYTSGEARESISLTAIARQIAAARTPLSAPTSHSSSFVRVASSAEQHVQCPSHHSRHLSPSPTQTDTSRSSLRAEPVGVLLKTLARFADKLAAQSAAQSAAQLSALSAVMQRLETLHPALSPSQLNRIYQPAIA